MNMIMLVAIVTIPAMIGLIFGASDDRLMWIGLLIYEGIFLIASELRAIKDKMK